RLVAIEAPTGDRQTPPQDEWRTIIPEPDGRDVLASVSMVGNTFLAAIRTHAHEVAKAYDRDGRFLRDVPLPGIGSVGAFSGKRSDTEAFFSFTSFTYPATIFRYDLSSGDVSVFKRPETAFNAEPYETKQVFYRSKD